MDTLVIDVEYNTEDPDYGPVYVATHAALGLVTDGTTFEELTRNLQDALDVCLADTALVAGLGLSQRPVVELRMVLPYGETA